MSSNSQIKPHVLVTNDDGIDSAFLQILVEALTREFTVSVAAPADEQSWIGRAISRRDQLEVVKQTDYPVNGVEAWSISGTPTDCVNIALGHLLTKKPDIVVSGINIGYNTTEALIYSSGTIAGALEGAVWNLPAIAFSQRVPQELFESVRISKGGTEGAFAEALKAAATHACSITQQTLQNPPAYGTVVNVNFPENTSIKTEIEETFPERVELGSLYAEVAPNRFEFRFKEGKKLDNHPQTDRAALSRGKISRSLLAFPRVGFRPETA